MASGWQRPEEAPIGDGNEFPAELMFECGHVTRARWGLHSYPGIGKGYCWRTDDGEMFGLYEVLAWRPLRH